MINKRNTLLVGTITGAIIGLLAAMLLHRQAEKSERDTTLTTGEGLRLGVLIIGLLRAITSLGDE